MEQVKILEISPLKKSKGVKNNYSGLSITIDAHTKEPLIQLSLVTRFIFPI